MHMSVLIEGPKQPGNDLNLYLGLLKEELDTLWRTPVNTWDALEGAYFPMKAALLTTVHDYLGYGYVAGQVVHGFCGCARCMDDTTYRQLDRDSRSSKTVFMDIDGTVQPMEKTQGSIQWNCRTPKGPT